MARSMGKGSHASSCKYCSGGGGLSEVSAFIRPALALLPFLLLLTKKKYKPAILYFIFIAAVLSSETFMVVHTQGA